MAGTTGLEPAASAVTGQRSNQLNYVPTRQNNAMPNNQCLCGLARIVWVRRLPQTPERARRPAEPPTKPPRNIPRINRAVPRTIAWARANNIRQPRMNILTASPRTRKAVVFPLALGVRDSTRNNAEITAELIQRRVSSTVPYSVQESLSYTGRAEVFLHNAGQASCEEKIKALLNTARSLRKVCE